MKIPKSCEECGNSFCRSLTAESRNKLLKCRIWISYKKKVEQMFFLENRQLLIIERGALACTRNTVEDKQQNIDILGPGDLLGCVNLFVSNERDMFRVYPLVDTYGCMIPIQSMEKLAMENPDISRALIAHLSKRYSRVVDNLIKRGTGTSRERLKYAISVLNEHGVGQEDVSHEALSLLTGLSRVTVTKTMQTIFCDDIE